MQSFNALHRSNDTGTIIGLQEYLNFFYQLNVYVVLNSHNIANG